ncbi:MAG: RimK/LysX family protein [Halioglobus sp.]|nr:RimK/LysX family protein [Halioglobus sp.]
MEFATIQPWDIKVKAKLDSGALTSSMQAEDIEEFERDDENWVRFTLEVEDEASGEVISKIVEKPLYRDFNAIGAGGTDHRKVVLMKICIGSTISSGQAWKDRRRYDFWCCWATNHSDTGRHRCDKNLCQRPQLR